MGRHPATFVRPTVRKLEDFPESRSFRFVTEHACEKQIHAQTDKRTEFLQQNVTDG